MTEELPTQAGAALPGAVLCIVGLGLVPLAVALARHLYPQRVVFFARWGFSHLVLILGLWLVANLAAGSLLQGASTTTLLTASVVLFGILGAAVVRIAQVRHPDLREALGLQTDGVVRAMFTGAAVLLFVLPGLFGLTLVWPWLFELLGGEYETQRVLLEFLRLEGGALVWALLVAVLLQPFLEELLFRGFVQPLLSQNLGEQGGIAVTSALFAILHGPSAFLPLFAFSYCMGAVMLRTRRLAAPWAMHALFNALNLGVFLAVPESREMLSLL